MPIQPYPGVAMRLQKLVSSGNYGTRELATIAAGEPVVVSRLFLCANGAAFASSGEAKSLAEAITRLGGQEVVRIAIAACLGVQNARPGPLASVRARIWQEAITGALIAAQIGHARRVSADEAFLCGLLHDIGRVVAVSCLEVVLARHGDRRLLSEDEWLAEIEPLKTEMGVLVATHWKLPDVVKAAISDHRAAPEAGPHGVMATIIRTSDEVVRLLMSEAHVTDSALLAIPTMNRAEATLLLGVIPSIGPLVAGLTDKPPSSGVSGTFAIPSQVVKPAQPAPEAAPPEESDIPVTLFKGRQPLPGRCNQMFNRSFSVAVAQPVEENYLVKVVFAQPGEVAFEVHARVLSCTPGPRGFQVQAALFALAGPGKERWNALLKSVTAAPPSRRPNPQ